MSGELREHGYPVLARLVALRPPKGPPLLVVAARYFFRREIETDRELFQGLAFARLDQLSESQEAGFHALATALDEHAERLEELLDNVLSVVVETHGDVLDIKSELQRQGRQMQELGKAVLQALQQHQLEKRELHPGDSLSLRGDTERQLVKGLVARYRVLPEDERRRLPALLNAVGKLEVAAGDFEAAQRDFQKVATLVPDPKARAEAQHNGYQAALERRAWPEALAALHEAARLDPQRFGPFPLDKFEPERILGAGGFGVAFLCRNRHSGSRVVVKTLRSDTLERNVAEVFREAQVLEELEHPAIIRVRDCDYADAARTRPYVVMDYFPGSTLAEYVEQKGPLSAEHLVELGFRIGEGLQKAHAKGILHRDVKPANLLVRQVPGARGDSAPRWEVKLIDFGLAMRKTALQSTSRSQADRTVTGSSIAGTLDYAAPEQMGRLPNVPVGPYSDVYGFAKTCCYALFRTPQPTFQHWQRIPPSLAELLGHCLAEQPKDRPSDFNAVLHRLSRIQTAAAPVILDAEPAEAVAVAEPVLPATRKGPRSASSVRAPRTVVRSGVPRREWEEEDLPRRTGGVGKVVIVLVSIMVPVMILTLLIYSFHLLQPTGDSSKSATVLNQLGSLNAPALPPPKALSPVELKQAVNDWPTADLARRTEIANNLGATPVDVRFREEVVKDLKMLLPGKDKTSHIAVAKALGRWGTPEIVPDLMEMVANGEWDSDVRFPAMDALVQLKDKRGANAIASRLGDGWDGPKAKEALLAFGTDAEDAVIKLLRSHPANPGEEWLIKPAACEVLKKIGTAKCIPTLEEVARDSNPHINQVARDALNAVKERSGE
jgi:serine/threonine protein kinase